MWGVLPLECTLKWKNEQDFNFLFTNLFCSVQGGWREINWNYVEKVGCSNNYLSMLNEYQ